MTEPIVHLVEGRPFRTHTLCCNRATWDFVEMAMATDDPAKVTCSGPERHSRAADRKAAESA